MDYTVLMDDSTLGTLEDVYSQKFIHFIVIADFIMIAFVLIITPLLCKETFFQRSCKLGNNYATSSKEYLVISTFTMFVLIHTNHVIFIIFGFLVDPIHGIAKLIEFVTTVTYFISIFNIIFHHHRKHKDDRKSRFLHYTKLGFKLTFFYLYFIILFFVLSYVLYDDLMATEYQSLIKSISISILFWLVIISIHFSYRWSGTVNYNNTTTNTTKTVATNNNSTNVLKKTSRSHQIEKGGHLLKETARLTIGLPQQGTDQDPLIDTSAENSKV